MAADPRFDALEEPLPPEFETFDDVVGAPLGDTTHLQIVSPNVNAFIHPITLVRRDNPRCAYAEITGPGWPRPLGGRAANNNRPDHWGQARLGVIYPKVGENTYQVPESADTAEYVIIKCINKNAIEEYRRIGGRENPRKEVARMLELGDDVHVLRCEEFLEDSRNIYIITQRGESLLDWFNSNGRDIFQFQAVQVFFKILRILHYLRQHRICHHDISPDNFLFLPPDGELVVFDLAMSIRFQVRPETGMRHRITEPGIFYGTIRMTTPEVLSALTFDGVQLDVWGAVVIFKLLLLGFAMWNRPDWTDPLFRIFVLGPDGEGIRNMQMIDDALVMLDEHEMVHAPLTDRMRQIWTALVALPEDFRMLLAGSFQVDPNDRLSLDELLAHFAT